MAKSALKTDNLTGQTFGRWTVLGPGDKNAKGEQKWLCQCECGSQRQVLGRSLRSGGSLSCGCLRVEKLRQSIAHDLTGKIFGDLTVLGVAEHQRANGGTWWRCLCSCGREYETTATLLASGKRTHCGCKTEKNQPTKDITGMKFSRLTALYPTKKRDYKGSVMWHCRCDCGNELEVSYNSLAYTNIKSCGCQKREHDKKLGSFLSHVDGTSVDMLKSRKIPSNNTTGVRGVYFVRGKYMAKIVFRKKQYFLGAYDTIEEAARVRRAAEEQLNDAVVAHFEAWQAKAADDPKWAEENPISIHVEKDGYDSVFVKLFPELEI